MELKRLLGEIPIKNRNLYYKLNIIFGLFFLFPVFGFIFFAVRYEILSDKYIPLFFLGVLVFSFLGFMLLRKLFDKIRKISKDISESITAEIMGSQVVTDSDELQSILNCFDAIENRFRQTSRQLEKRATEISILKELSELCYITFDPDEILGVALERSLMLTNSDIGSVLILEKADQKSFVVKASIGLGELVKINDRIDFETSVAKYAVINKSPLVVEDIEKDTRFGRGNRSQYGTKSFVCMPLKTSKEIIGVITISRKEGEKQFKQEDVEALTPLLSNAAFTYENLYLMKENEQGALHLEATDKIFKVINSSFRDSELLHAVLNVMQGVVPFDVAIVITIDEKRTEYVIIFDLLTSKPVNISKGASYACKGTIIDKVLKQGTILIVDGTESLSNEVEKELFANQGCSSCLLAPLKIDGVVKGILALSGQNADIFRDAQVIIEFAASGLALAIERNALSAAVVKRNQELETIKQIGSALASSTFDINHVLNYTMDMIRELMNVEGGSLYLVDKDELDCAVSFNIEFEALKKFRLKLGQGIAGYVASRGESIIVNNVEKSPHFYGEIDSSTGFKTKSALCVPMISQGKVTGVLEVINKVDGDFDVEDEDLLQSIASSVSIAIENARLYRETVSMAEHERGIRRMFQKFVPKEILDKIIHGDETGKEMIEELKTLTLLNIDLRGFSELTREMGFQKTVSLLNRFFSVMGGIVFKNHGIVDKYLGDGFLAVFGAPVSSTTDADNAVAAALEMKQSIREVNEYFVKELGVSVNMGISVHTGEVVVGNIGFEKKMDYTVTGDAVNTVFRLQELTKRIPNGVLIGENTRRAVQSRLEIREIDYMLEGLKIYELVGYKLD